MRIDNINCSNSQYNLVNSNKVIPVSCAAKSKKYKENKSSKDNKEKGFQKKLKKNK